MLNSLNEKNKQKLFTRFIEFKFWTRTKGSIYDPLFTKLNEHNGYVLTLYIRSIKKSIYFQQPKNRKIEICLERDKVNTNTLKLKDNLT